MATVIFAVQNLKRSKEADSVSERDLFDYVLEWKKGWKNDERKQAALAETIRSLEMLRWVKLRYSESLSVAIS